ncbi:acyl carrier protein [Nocardia yunnanensis]|uniref:Acyl carrier protein n=2 Tax=Nocardia yunnanensis TaxID=2382165 RepID=A0A386ZI21_9NOCA|nr:acyl carrier protein [Nocardia yunnanensis]
MEEIVAFLAIRNPEFTGADPDLDLIESRTLDSLGLVEFLLLLQELTGSEMDMGTVDLGTIRTLGQLRAAYFTQGER